MTVLWVDLVSELGGAQRSLYEVCTELVAQDVKVVAAVPYGPLFDLLKAAGLTVFPVSAIRAHKHGWGLFTTTAKLLRAPNTVSQIIRTVKPDIVHVNSLTALLAVSKNSISAPVFWHVRDLHLPALVAREASKNAERIIAASEAIDEYLVDILSPRMLGHIRVIRNGIDISRFSSGNKSDARNKFGLPQNAPVFGMIAHIIPWKGHDAFIRAAADIHKQRPDAFFVAVGRDLFKEHGRHLAKLKSQIQQEGLENCFKWIHDLDAAEVILPAFDALLHPAQREPFGRVICEAMAAKVPVIAADEAGPADIIEQRVSGILVRDGDPHLMAEEALALLSDPARAARMAEEGFRTVLSRFTVQRVGKQLLQEYQATLVSGAHSSKDDDE
jgi:glycosyltransferase involved in cell wall biosynthesis